MADSFFGFNTSLSGFLDEELADGPGPEFDEEEEEYDALNNETFGADAFEGDWEEDHEKLAELAEQARHTDTGNKIAPITGPISSTPHRNNVYHKQSIPRSDSSEDLELEARVAHLMLEEEDEADLENDVIENGDIGTAESPQHNNHLENVANFPKASDVGAFQNSSQTKFPVWGIGKLGALTMPPPASTVATKSLTSGKNVCTVEELERGLIQQSTVSTPLSAPQKQPSAVLCVEDIERELTMPSTCSNNTSIPAPAPVTTVAATATSVSQPTAAPHVPQFPPPPIPTQSQDVNLGHQPPLGCGINFPPPVLGIGRAAPHPNGPPFLVPPPPRVVPPPTVPPPAGLHPALLHPPNHRMGSNPNLLRFIPPHLMGPPGTVGKNLPHPVFPGDNGLLRGVHHRGPNVQFRPGFPIVDPMWQQQNQHLQQQPHHPPLHPLHHHALHLQQQQQQHLHQQRLRPGGKTPNQRQHHNDQQQNGIVDEYAGLMTPRERQWLLGIQMLQLNTNTPHIDDYYYTVFITRHLKDDQSGSRLVTAAQQHHQQLQRQRERRDSQRSDGGLSTQPRVYMPAQFENSLGKLQVGSVTAPRKIIDMDVMNTDTSDIVLTAQQKELRKIKQLLLEIERLYMLLLQVEDLKSDIPEIREAVTEDKESLLQKIVSAIITDDRLANILSIRKGRKLLVRLLPQLSLDSDNLSKLWARVIRSLSTTTRRELESLYPHFRKWLATQDNMAPLIEIVGSPLRTFCVTNKFALSVYGALLERAEQLSSGAKKLQLEAWASFVRRLGAAVSALSAPTLPETIQPLDGTLAVSNLRRHCPTCNGCEHLSRAFGPRDSSVSR